MANDKEIIIDTRLGQQTITLDKIIHFPQGVIGLEDKHTFTLLQVQEESPFIILQSIDDPKLGLLVADPYSFITEYKIKLSDAEKSILRIKTIKQLAVLVTMTIPKGKPELTTLNLTGPILINYESKIGLQVPQAHSEIPNQVYLYPPTKQK